MIELKILLECKNAEVIAKSLSVDNINLPKNMIIESRSKDNSVEITIKMKIERANDILTVRNTADEILLHIKNLQQSLNSVS
ncbi:KEOPS complex subunit Pcc1 [Saccharolobus caldissimus]|uniref:KEOPS complex subunit n=1 Tax=Saccharolobus caldissimus TaxID=1702097 RepID=A0AAQ4CN10_9CREN|nr:KEOPS complex subunit Pcc1 [Saccharolobus caldissimus]BDB97191.1 hypothetical protein SACC_02080 [Saccharolobus caldissimus]